jgi:hypothetical protein
MCSRSIEFPLPGNSTSRTSRLKDFSNKVNNIAFVNTRFLNSPLTRLTTRIARHSLSLYRLELFIRLSPEIVPIAILQEPHRSRKRFLQRYFTGFATTTEFRSISFVHQSTNQISGLAQGPALSIVFAETCQPRPSPSTRNEMVC